ncbi:MAG TPA: 2-C-methyl-D-erythritol 4-phosphate cytidylyltransferase [Bacteroidales bacterium]|jgi:2-C-methyl-D-erythritol 4-phosphate cytidylyltransferase|nr:2-C-methyl-D-erythritol 4-phosphate cytidylyltransferase [Bacteroidales bacterium]
MKRFVIIVAGGSGQRMGSSIPKQFLSIHKEIILMKSIRAFYEFDSTLKIILALPENHISYWNDLCQKHKFLIEHSIVSGGLTRYHSVKNALEKINTNGIVAIHDGVRPLVSQATIEQVFEIATINGNAIPYIDLIDSLRFVDSHLNYPADRNKYKLIQTPQAFDCELIKRAYEQEYDKSFTDDASIVEKLGIKINLVPGNPENIKITSQTDIKIAEALSV